MRRKLTALIVFCVCCLLAAAPALAADVFVYADRTMTIFEGDTVNPAMQREGKFARDGEISYTVNNKKICAVDENGNITALSRGTAIITASLTQNGKLVKRASIQITVARRVTKVTLSTKNLQIYEPDDEDILELLGLNQEEEEPGEEDPEAKEEEEEEEEEPLTDRILVVPAGKSVLLSAVCTPEDATNKKISYETSDVGVAKIVSNRELRGIQYGQCQLTVRSVQNPEITETFLVFVIEPVKKITIDAPFKNVAAGSSMQLDAVFTPDNATIQKVTWSSRNPKIATVDEDGTVTGLAKGKVTIDAKAGDGSNVVGSIALNVTQDVTEITIAQTDVTVATGRNVQLRVSVLPQSANDRTVTWTSSDENVAKVRNGNITGIHAGDCIVTCTSNSNPAVSASIPVSVIQMVTKITFDTAPGLTFPIRTSRTLAWTVWPDDASIQDVTFKSLAPKIATVDQDGTVTGISRGQAKIVATATDGSGRQGTYVVTITQPVEGIEIPYEMYYVQKGRSTDIRPTILPKNANNQRVSWSSNNERVATVKTAGTSIGRVTGVRKGTTVVTAETDDGGYTASAEVIVDDFDAAIQVEGAWIDDSNRIRLTLRNTSDFTINNIRFLVQCFDTQAEPMVCNKDGISVSFVGTYPWDVESGERTQHGQFNFSQYMETGNLGYVIITVLGYSFEDDQKWTIPEEYRIPYQSLFSEHMWELTAVQEQEEPQEYEEDEEDD